MSRPVLGITMGDPAGIGPEIIARAFGESDFREENRAIVVGDAGILERAARLTGSRFSTSRMPTRRPSPSGA